MAIEANKLPLLHPTILLVIICPLLSLSHAHHAIAPAPTKRSGGNHTMHYSTFEFAQMEGHLFLMDSGTYLPGSLGSYMKNNSSSVFNLSDTGLFIIPNYVFLWEEIIDDGMELREVSFSIAFSMRVYRTQANNSSRLIFAILPGVPYGGSGPMSIPLNGSLGPSNRKTNTIASSHVSVHIGGSSIWGNMKNNGLTWVQITIEQAGNISSEGNYGVWIDYDHISHHMWVYVDIDAVKKPFSPIADIALNMRDTMGQVGLFSISSSMGQLLQLHSWSSTVEKLRLSSSDCPSYSAPRATNTFLPWVLITSAVMTAAMVYLVYCYFKSKYRRWKKDLDKLAKSMQRLPGMPIHVKFPDIKKATNNFDEKMKLGGGRFGAVYKCRLRPHKNGDVLRDVAVKKFARDDNRRYEDFLTEVSIISRLRHKNIVTLIGWSFHRGETLLVYEYMPNGSLDQHLFRKISNQQQQQQTTFCQWHTRYNIVKDVATGLRYIHHEYEPYVLHRDIKASNIMIDSSFRGRLGDFGIACVVADGRNSYTDMGAPGTLGFRAPEYIQSGKATRKTDIFAFGVLILEIVTGKPPVSGTHCHITEWVWNFHREGKLLDAVDPVLTSNEQFNAGDVRRLLLLGLACSSPNPLDRPSMVEALQVITNLAAPPDVPLEKPRFVWQPEECSCSTNSNNRTAAFENRGNNLHHGSIGGQSQEEGYSFYHTAQL